MKLPFSRKFRDYIQHNRVVKAEICFVDPAERLKGKHIIVTGGTSGIGQAMAKRFVAEGAKVLIAARNQEKLDHIAAELGCEALVLDLTKVDTFEAFVDQAEKKLGKIDCLVNNAGVSWHEKTLERVTVQSFDHQISTNLRGPFFLSQRVLIQMEKNGIKGHVIFISSETGDMADIRPYGLTKAAINSLVQGLAYYYIEKGIRVNAIAPGVTATKMSHYNPEENINCPFNPNGRAYLPEEIAETAVFLLSDVSSCISGQVITCNNGKTINARWK